MSGSSGGALTHLEVLESGVAVLRIDRPDARNAINVPMLRELIAHLGSAAAEERIRVLVLSSSDTRGLSAGADVREQLDKEAQIEKMSLFSELYDLAVGLDKPTIAVCVGSVVGGGAELAVCCDLRVAGTNMGLRFPGAALGVPVGPARLVSLCGLATAKYLLLTSRTVDADEALRLGLVNEVADPDEAEDRAIALAREIAAHPPESVSRLKSMLHRWDGVEERSQAEGRGQIEFVRDAAFPSGSA